MRAAITEALRDAMKARDAARTSTLRLVNAAIKDKDIANRGQNREAASDDEIVQIMTKMVKQREESAKIYEDNARPELAAKEREEIAVIAGFMPAQMDEAGMEAAVAATIADLGAAGMKDMGRVMGALKERHAGQMDFGKANGVVKRQLTAG
ncbi:MULTISPECIES: GatB/YqeY domain-containing protein [unclassified Aureimonas]|uniref:GatB/YqeY domain-containing protein n=1 Tax=unclassified Aureimonas TaxID=2615206 RepID=UPI0006F35502|nr:MULTISPECIES: GatB/YqeY domain-containing protein [unclassified Aureimonas]KQT69607.1 glutamyl-tRNA amidotransferase [Aureimonas sp. Leaf427]KQT80958.1 glutamyl-tRNA amidotransferase [Aureimonas sp. Leaf460]